METVVFCDLKKKSQINTLVLICISRFVYVSKCNRFFRTNRIKEVRFQVQIVTRAVEPNLWSIEQANVLPSSSWRTSHQVSPKVVIVLSRQSSLWWVFNWKSFKTRFEMSVSRCRQIRRHHACVSIRTSILKQRWNSNNLANLFDRALSLSSRLGLFVWSFSTTTRFGPIWNRLHNHQTFLHSSPIFIRSRASNGIQIRSRSNSIMCCSLISL